MKFKPHRQNCLKEVTPDGPTGDYSNFKTDYIMKNE